MHWLNSGSCARVPRFNLRFQYDGHARPGCWRRLHLARASTVLASATLPHADCRRPDLVRLHGRECSGGVWPYGDRFPGANVLCADQRVPEYCARYDARGPPWRCCRNNPVPGNREDALSPGRLSAFNYARRRNLARRIWLVGMVGRSRHPFRAVCPVIIVLSALSSIISEERVKHLSERLTASPVSYYGDASNIL